MTRAIVAILLIAWASFAQSNTQAQVVYTPIHAFASGDSGAYGGFILGKDGNFYGATGGGTFYRISATGAYLLLHNFDPATDGSAPYGPLAMDPSGAIYGVTSSNTAYRYTPDGVFTSFGALPGGLNSGFKPNGLIYASDGNLYGTASGPNGGQVFRLTPQGVSTVIYSFASTAPGGGPNPSFFVQGLDGALYGVLFQGAMPLVRLTLAGDLSMLTNLGNTAGGVSSSSIGPSSIVAGSDGTFYIEASTALLQVTPAGAVNQSVPDASGTFLDYQQTAPMIQATDGNLYAAPTSGGYVEQISTGLTFTLYLKETGAAGTTGTITALAQGPDASLYCATGTSTGGGIYRITLIPGSGSNSGGGSSSDAPASAGDGFPDDGSGEDYGVTTALGDPSDIAGSLCLGDPVCVASGNLYETVTDYRTAGANQLSFARSYNSIAAANTYATSLGPNWRSNYDRYLRIGVNSAVAERADGQRVTFNRVGTEWVTDRDIDLQLLNSGTTWSITDPTDTSEVYTSINAGEALLTSIQARNGYTQKLQYGAGNQVASLTDSFGRQLSFTYNGSQLQSVGTPDGLTLTYGYTGNLLTSVGYSTSSATSQTYLYENPTLPASLTGIVDENGNRYATWTYDASGRVLTSSNGNGANLTTYAYNPDGTRTVTNPLGEQEVYKFATVLGVSKVVEIDRLASASLPAATRTFAYDANGYVRSQTDWNGNLTTFVNDNRGEPTTINEAVGTPQARTTNTTYHAVFHLPIQIETPGLTTTFKYDFSGELLTKTVTDTTTTTIPYATQAQSRTWTYTWSNFLLASTQTPRTDLASVTKFAYDSSGALVATTNALGQMTQTVQHQPGGLPSATVDANGVTTSMTYDARQRLLTSALSTASGVLTTSYTYDAAGNLLTLVQPDGSQVTDTYDSAHRLTGYSNLFNESVSYTLDALGDRTQTIVTDVNGNVQRTHSAVFDALGRVQQDIGGAGQTTTYAYDSNGNAVAITDPLGRVTRQTFDALNRRISIVDPNGGVTTIAYDAHDRPVTVTDAKGNVTTNVYDGFGDLIQRVSPDAGTSVITYDADGNVTQKVNSNGSTTNYAYDALDRALTIGYPGDPAENVAYTYDQGNLGIGRLTGVADAAGALTRAYDERGNLLSEARTNAAASLANEYSYDAASRLASVTYPSGWSAVYSRDAMGRIAGVTAQSPDGASAQVVTIDGYQPFGPLNALTFGNGIGDARTFDLDYRIAGLAEAGVVPIESLSYGYDAANNVLSIADGVNQSNGQVFQYDALNRMTGAIGGYGNYSYTYDAAGNRLAMNAGAATSAYSYAPGSNQLAALAIGGATQLVVSDQAGNITSLPSSSGGGVLALEYNQANRLAAVMSGTNLLAQYTYDALGRRVARAGAVTGTTFFQYDPDGHLLEETDGEGNAQVDYVYLGSTPVATISPDTGQIYFLHNNYLGAPQSATDINQNVVWTAVYGPFGELGATPGLIAQNLRLPGQEFDANTGFYHNGFREYVPQWGRYLQSDPLGVLGGTNTYSYAGGNPARYADPRGLIPEILDKTFESVFHFSVDKVVETAIEPYVPQGTATFIAGGITTVAGQLLTPGGAAEAIACPECLALNFIVGGINAVGVEGGAQTGLLLGQLATGDAYFDLSDAPWNQPQPSSLIGIASPLSPDWSPNLGALAGAGGAPAAASNSSSNPAGSGVGGTTFGFYTWEYLSNTGDACSPQ